MIKKTFSNQPCGRDSEYINGAFLKSFSIYSIIIRDIMILIKQFGTDNLFLNIIFL